MDGSDGSGAYIRASPGACCRFEGCSYFELRVFHFFSCDHHSQRHHELEQSCIVQPHSSLFFPVPPRDALMPVTMG